MVMIARDIVEKDFISLPGESTAFEAAKLMKARHHGFVVVAAAGGAPEGMVTEWDFLSKLIAEGRDPAKVRLEEIMTTTLVTVNADEELDSVSQFMTQRQCTKGACKPRWQTLGRDHRGTMLSRMKAYVDRISAQIARLQMPHV